MNPKDVMIYSDMDGTLLSSWEKGPVISEKNTHAIHQFMNNGGLFSIATGRNMKNGPTYFKDYELKLPMVLVNGALIYDHKHQTIIRKIALNPSFLHEALDYDEHHDNVILVISDLDEVYHVHYPNKSYDHSPALDFQTQTIFYEDVKQLDILKVTFVTHPEDKDDVMNDIMQMPSFKEVSISPSSRRFIEIVNQGINKAEAIQYVKNHYDIQRTLVCIGDYLNDEEMLDHADIACIPQNGLDSLKKPGRLITKHHDDDAIADLIDQLERMQ